ncbi:MAG: hypothetical protein OEW18_01770 [Candidatus Aminicenantes bacterium]|nr:hypothetical protein [Candidatus Aminicenantes bacterium]
MTHRIVCPSFLFSVIVVFGFPAQQHDFPVLKGPYLGQKPPGMTPEVFGPGLISTEDCFECCRAISPDGREFYFVREIENGNKIFRMIEEKDGWTKPERITYSDAAFQYTPFISPDGKRFLFMTGNSNPKRNRSDSPPEIWISSKKGDEWIAPVCIGTLIGSVQPFYITMAKNGTLYFSCVDRDGIYRSEWKDGKYSPAGKLPDMTGSLEQVNHPFVAPDESYLIMDAVNREAGNKDLYISYRRKDGSWTDAVKLGDMINSSGNEMCPSVTHDGKFIFFGRLVPAGKTDIYWVSSRIIEELRPDKAK